MENKNASIEKILFFPLFSDLGSLHPRSLLLQAAQGWVILVSTQQLLSTAPSFSYFSFATVWILHGLQGISALAPGASPPPPAHMTFCVPPAFSHNFCSLLLSLWFLPFLRHVFPEELTAWPCFARRSVGESWDGLCSPWSLLTEVPPPAPPL